MHDLEKDEFIDPNSDFGPEEFVALLEDELARMRFHASETDGGRLHAVTSLPRQPEIVEALEAEYKFPGMYRMAITIDGEVTDTKGSNISEAVGALIEKLKRRKSAYESVIQRLELAFVLSSLDGTSNDD